VRWIAVPAANRRGPDTGRRAGFANLVLFVLEVVRSSMETSCPGDGFQNVPGSPGAPQTKNAEEKYAEAEAGDLDVELAVAARPEEEAAQYDCEKTEESILDNNEKAACSADDFAGGLVGSVDAERDVAAKFVSHQPGTALKVRGVPALLNDACDFIVTRLRVLIDRQSAGT
jgi:hypothetical protein